MVWRTAFGPCFGEVGDVGRLFGLNGGEGCVEGWTNWTTGTDMGDIPVRCGCMYWGI